MALETLGIRGGVDKLGIAKIEARFNVDTEEEALAFLFARAPRNGIPFSEGSYDQDDDASFNIAVTYEGFPPDGGPADEELTEFSFDGSMSEERVESNPNFDRLKEFYLFDPTEKMFTGERADTPSSDGLPGSQQQFADSEADKIKGTDKWLVVGGEYRISYSSRVVPPGLFRDIGTVVTRPRGIGAFNLELGAREFLKLMPRAVKRGNAVEIEERYLLSGPKGIPRGLYEFGQLG